MVSDRRTQTWSLTNEVRTTRVRGDGCCGRSIRSSNLPKLEDRVHFFDLSASKNVFGASPREPNVKKAREKVSGTSRACSAPKGQI